MTVQQITLADYDILKTILESGDRGGFYLKYYELTGSRMALIQAHITTYSGFFGGSAIFGNAIAKYSNAENYPETLDMFSRQIADALLISIKNNIDPDGDGVVDGTGILTDQEILDSDRAVWNSKDMGDYFPGNYLMATESINDLFSAGTLSSVLAGMQHVFASKLGYEADDYDGYYLDESIPGVTVFREGGPTGKVVYVEEHLGIVEEETQGTLDEPALALASKVLVALSANPGDTLLGTLVAGYLVGANDAVGNAALDTAKLAFGSMFSDAQKHVDRLSFDRFLGAHGEDVDPNATLPLAEIFNALPILMNAEGTLDDSEGAHILIGHGSSTTDGWDGEDLLIAFDDATMAGGAGQRHAAWKGDSLPERR